MPNESRVGASFYGLFAVIAVATYLIHEAAHWLVGRRSATRCLTE